ncbi:MAG: TonB family protein [Cyclobacteriaceae bacterium]
MELKKNENLDLQKKSPLFFTIGLVISMSLVAVAFEWKSEFEPVEVSTPKDEPIVFQYPIATNHEEPEPPKPIEPKAEKPKPIQPPIIVDTKNKIEPKKEGKTEIIDIDIDTEYDDAPSIEVPEKTFIIVESMPSFPGGDIAFLQYMAKKIKYPKSAKTVGAEGVVYLEFIINKDGSISDVKLLRGIGMGCDQEAIRVLLNSPKWNPGKQRGVPVRVKRTIPVNFKLN